MRPLAFTDELKFGVAVIDRQHRRMVKIVNMLLGAALEGELGKTEDRLLDELVGLAEINFRTEELWMRRCRYERCDAHTQSHAILLGELVELRSGMFTRHESLNRKVVLFVRRWLESHLVHSDRDLAEAIRVCLKAEARAQAGARRRSAPPARKRLT